MTIYAVHAYAVVRVKSDPIEASSPEEAIKLFHDRNDISKLVDSTPCPAIPGLEYSEFIGDVVSHLVDEIDEDCQLVHDENDDIVSFEFPGRTGYSYTETPELEYQEPRVIVYREGECVDSATSNIAGVRVVDFDSDATGMDDDATQVNGESVVLNELGCHKFRSLTDEVFCTLDK